MILFFLLCHFITTSALILGSIETGSNESYDYPDKYVSEEEVAVPTHFEIRNCTRMEFRCESCSTLVMCIDTEFGYKKQYLSCSAGQTCLHGRCTIERNPLCDGTADLPFVCHVPGLFPDPFNCKKYHFCVPASKQIVNETLQFHHFETACPDQNDLQFKFDPKTGYCKYPLEHGCTEWPIPLCQFEGETAPLINNKSIFYICDLIKGHLYPYLYVCPHGEEYNPQTTKCEEMLHSPTEYPHWQ